MIGSNYKAHRDNVIDLYAGYCRNRKAFDSSMKSEEGDGRNLKFLESRINSLKNGKFTLAVAGEVKAGKSTFINALLGAELLPSDVLQATSAIVEIFKSEKSYLKVKYADLHEEEIYDDLNTLDVDEAREKLHKICIINDEFRDIPTTLIDKYIADSDDKFELTEAIIQEWESEVSTKLSDNNEILNKYIKTRSKDKIPVEIEFGYPLKWDFDELRIVDSPGVNALGGVQNVSFSYFEDANAILFVHKIPPIESESFKKFVKTTISNRSRETLFLVLTHISNCIDEDIRKLHEDSFRIYGNLIPANRILTVDSLLQLIVHDFENGMNLEEIRKNAKKRKVLASYREKAEDEGRDLYDLIKESAQFDKMFSAIEHFSMQAPNLQLREILQSLREGYSQQESEYSSKITRLESKKRAPQEFENEIYRIKSALENYKSLLNNTIEDINQKHTGKHANWQNRIKELKVMYPELITKCTDIESVRKNLTDGINDINNIINKFSQEITTELKGRLQKIGEEFKQDNNITLPSIDLQSIEDETKKQAFRIEGVYEKRVESILDNLNWLKFKWTKNSRTYTVKTGEKQVYNKEEHLKSFKTTCMEKFYELINGLPQQSKNLLETYLKLFSDSVNKVIKDRQDALSNELKKKESNEEIINQISELRKKKGLLPAELHRIEAILQDIQ